MQARQLLGGAEVEGLFDEDFRHIANKSQIPRRKSQTNSNTKYNRQRQRSSSPGKGRKVSGKEMIVVRSMRKKLMGFGGYGDFPLTPGPSPRRGEGRRMLGCF